MKLTPQINGVNLGAEFHRSGVAVYALSHLKGLPMVYIVAFLTLFAIVTAYQYWTTRAALQDARRIVNQISRELQGLDRSYTSLVAAAAHLRKENEWRRELFAKICALITRRTPRRRWLAISKHVAAVAVEGYDPHGHTMNKAARAYWLEAAERELRA